LNTTPRPGLERSRFTELDGMRGLLAVLVMLYHLGLNSQLARWTGGWLQASQWQLCVDFFFVLSGFVLIFFVDSFAQV
jgi:peptidoglycan/LPS O-acetylase OafA/YrhL